MAGTRSSTSVPASTSLHTVSLPPISVARSRIPRQAVVSLAALAGENRWINAFSIVPHTQPELLMVIADFNLDLLCLRVPKGIPECFGSNLINLVTKDRMKISRLALNRYTESCRIADCLNQPRVLLRECLWPAQDHCFGQWNRAIPAPHPELP